MNIKPVEKYGQEIAQAVARDKVYRLESVLKAMPQVDCPVTNYFLDGVYVRQMKIPAGTVITGAVHKESHTTMISKGRVLVLKPEGPVEYVAPVTFITAAGTKNAVQALEDTTWITFHHNPDDSQDMDILVERYTTSKNSDLLGNRELAHGQTEKVEA
jgi:hypothetical protein